MADNLELIHIKRCILGINKNVDDGKKDLNAFLENIFTRCDDMKSTLERDLLRVKPRRRKNEKASSVVQSKLKSDYSMASATFISSNDMNITETAFQIANESISCRTRGALRALQSSISSTRTTRKHNETQNNRSRSCFRRTKLDENLVIERNTEEVALGIDLNCGKIKKENFDLTETPTKSEEVDIFKKPKARGRKLKRKDESVSAKVATRESTIEEPITFKAVLHSSPNANSAESTFIASPKNLSVIPKSPRTRLTTARKESENREVETSIRASPLNSNDFINETTTETGNPVNELTRKFEDCRKSSEKVAGARKTTTKKSERKNSREFGKNIEETERTRSNVVVNDGASFLINAESSNNRKNTELPDKTSNAAKETEENDPREAEQSETKVDGASEKVVVDSSESNRAASSGKRGIASNKVIRETRSSKRVRKEDSPMVSPKAEPDDLAPLEDMNVTKMIPKATKRTKPVAKSKIFDSHGNLLPSVNSENNLIKTNSVEKPCSPAFNPEMTFKKEKLTLDAIKPMETNDGCEERRSNAENEPEAKRRKKTKAKKKAETEGVETVRITRTKSKEAKKAAEEVAARRSALMNLARKSLSRAKLICIQKDQTNVIRLDDQKSSNKLSTFSKDALLGSSNKLNTLPTKNLVINLGSHIKKSKVLGLKNNENLILTGKGKYTDLKGKLITPGKLCHSPELLIKSTTKTTREEEIEKELKLKALKEKEEEAQRKREMVIKMRQKELKEKNEKKLELATQQRKKLEMEKYTCKVETEKKKEEKRKLLLQEREMMKKEKARMKKEIMEFKLAETEERRRLEEEARVAKLREQEAEQQRIFLEKQKELERHEKRAQERLAEQKARENYEMKLKTEQKLREKQLAALAQSANKAGMGKTGNQPKEWNYKARNENDLGLDGEESELDSDNEKGNRDKNRPIPEWAQHVTKKTAAECFVKKSALSEYMKCLQKTPDIQKMFKLTPTKRIKRTSSAIWNTPSS